ncbi:gp53-like domain-containing protein [Treponema pectinovorum]|uniref:gp53-like domain-containing protein n=1 Tax=Treponema pectinovorum TaxID=164 RepID=UPI0011C736F5|nr:hypothetical protein [Treponema pectinovorum]
MAGMYPDNKEISSFGKTVKFPGVDEHGKFTNGDFSNPDIPPSFLDANTVNLIIDNLNALVAHLGGNANNTDGEQLKKLFSITAEANKAIKRDSEGRAKVSPPVEPDDIARKKEIDDIINGDIELKKLTVQGDIIQRGENKITHAEHVYTKQDMIHLREGAQTSLVENELAGLIAEKYDGLKNGILGFDKDGVAHVGDKGDEQPLACRAESSEMKGGALVGWNALKQRIETHLGFQFNGMQNNADRTNYTLCSSQANIQVKTCECAGFNLVTGAEITVKFTATNTANSPMLNVNNTGSRAIFYRGATVRNSILSSNCTYTFRYNGSQYELVGEISETITKEKLGLENVNNTPDSQKSVNYAKTAGSAGSASNADTVDGFHAGNANGMLVPVIDSKFESDRGYIKLGNGLLVQWGFLRFSGTGVSLISFPLTRYKNPPIVIAVINTTSPDEASRNMFQIFNVSRDSFNFYQNTTKGHGISWLAIGQAS